jgi:hypothetical protein
MLAVCDQRTTAVVIFGDHLKYCNRWLLERLHLSDDRASDLSIHKALRQHVDAVGNIMLFQPVEHVGEFAHILAPITTLLQKKEDIITASFASLHANLEPNRAATIVIPRN